VPDGVTLHDLIEALANSVIEAQDKVERYQMSNILRYFDENQRPRRLEIRVASLSPYVEPGSEDLISVPFLALVGSVRLGIKDVEISMEVDLGDLTAIEPPPEPPSPPAGGAGGPTPPASELAGAGLAPQQPRRAVIVDVRSPRTRDHAMAKVVLRVESQEPTEGLARLMLELNQRIGPIGTPRSPQGGAQ
jgi:hypothetical protein